jgi:hypothetical protein
MNRQGFIVAASHRCDLPGVGTACFGNGVAVDST